MVAKSRRGVGAWMRSAAAAGWKVLTQGTAMLEGLGESALLWGSVAAALAAAASVAFLAAWVRRHGLALFGWYRLGLAALVAGLLLTGALPPG